MRKYLIISLLFGSASSLPAFHLVSDTTAQAMQVEEIAEAVNMVKTGAEQIRAVMQVYKELKSVYNTIGEVRDMYNSISSYWDAFSNGWSFDSVDSLDEFMSTADDKLCRWGIQPATTGVLGDAVARSKSLRYDAEKQQSSLRWMPYDYSRDSVLNSIFTDTSYEKSKSSENSFFGLFSLDTISIKDVEDSVFGKSEDGIKVKTASGDLATPTAAEKQLLAEKAQNKLEQQFLKYSEGQAKLDAATKANIAKIVQNEDGAYSNDIAGITQKSVDIAALQVAATSDVTSAINQNTATNIKMSEIMSEVNKAKSEVKQMEDYGKLLE